jgi:hypothetical protein
MVCKNCKKRFSIKSSLHELFSKKYEYLCESCYKKYPIKLNITSIILDQYHCIILSIFKKKYYINYDYSINEYSKIYSSAMLKKGYIVLFFDDIYLNDFTIEIFDLYSKLFKKNLYIITFYLRN